MSYINDLPVPYDAGLEFNYDVWTPNTSITLCKVPWTADYRDIVYYNSTDDLISFLNEDSGPTIQFTNSTVVVPGKPIMLDIPVNQAYRYNYLHVHNPAMPGNWPNGLEDVPRDYFYFIHDVQYIAPNTTSFQVQLDSWQSFGHTIEFGNCFIERGHVGIANQNGYANGGRDYLTVPEGLDLGNEYIIRKNSYYEIASTRWQNYSVMVWSNTELHGELGNAAHPQLRMATGSFFEYLPNGVNIYLFETDSSWALAQDRLADYPWVTQGIISIMLIPNDSIPENYFKGEIVNIGNVQALLVGPSDERGKSYPVNMFDGESVDNLISETLPEKYQILHKFKTYPYSVFEVTTNNGTPIVLKPECIGTDSLQMNQHIHLAPPSPRIMYSPKQYNSDSNANNFPNPFAPDLPIFSGGEDMDMMTGISNFPTFSILNNSYTNYLASNANTLAYGAQSADWARQRTLAGADASYQIASSNIATSSLSTQQNNAALNQQNMISNDQITANTQLTNDTLVNNRLLSIGTNVGGGLINGAMSGGVKGAALGGIGGAVNSVPGIIGTSIEMNRNDQAAIIQKTANGRTTALSASNAAALNKLSNTNQAYARDTNLAFANYAANGDYQNAIGAINAKTQDAKLMQPTTSGQVGGEAFNIVVSGWFLIAKLKTLDNATMTMIGDYWLRYGYAINRFGRMPRNFACMSKFTYWKLRETYITKANCPELFKNTIRGIFEKGVTVWTNAREIGSVDVETNHPIKGIKL